MSKFQFRYICSLLWFIIAVVFNNPAAEFLALVIGVVFSFGAIYSTWKEHKEAHE